MPIPTPTALWTKAKASPVFAFSAATGVAQVFPLAVAPLLSRLYSPAAFGGYATFYAVSIVLGTVAALSMHNVILVEEKDEDAFAATFVILAAPLAFSLALAAVLLLAPGHLLTKLFPQIDPRMLLLLPATVLSASVFQAGYTWLLRMGRYRALAANKLILAAATAGLQVGIGFLQIEALGLILANLAGYILAILAVWGVVLSSRERSFRLPAIPEIRSTYARHQKFPLFTTPAQFVNSTANYLPDLLIGRMFGAEVLGQYSLGMRMVAMPLAFLTTTVQEVFRRDSSREFAATGGCQRSFYRIFMLTSGVAVLLLAPGIFVLPWVFPWVFGDQWSNAAFYIQAMAALLIVRFVSSPLSYVWIVTGRQKHDLQWQLGLLVITVASLFLPGRLAGPVTAVEQFVIFGTSVASWYALALYLSFRWSRTPV